jgi:hypothetical protein
MLKFILVFSALSSLMVSAQVDEKIGVRHTLVYSPTDYFYQVSCVSSGSRFQRVPFIGFGINRTIFQQRFYPEIGFQFAYLTTHRKLRILPYAQLSVNRLRITDNNAHYWVNSELGLRAEFHARHDFGIQAGYRNLNEFWRLDKKTNHSTGFGYTVAIYIKL